MKAGVPALVVALAACSEPGAENVSGTGFAVKPDLSGLNLSDPARDAARDFTAGAPKCYSINGYGQVFPGLSYDPRDSAYCRKREVNFSCTSDGGPGTPEAPPCFEQAAAYAEAYNRYILAHRR